MGIFNDNLDTLIRRNSHISATEIKATQFTTDDVIECPDCCSLITAANNQFYSNMMIPKEFKEKVLVHVVSQYMSQNEFFVPPLYLAIEGPAGEGKTSQTIAVLTQHDIDVLYVSAAEISGSHEGDSVGVLNIIYNYAIYRSERNRCIAILIDDFHMGTVNQDSKIEKTINSNLLIGRMMNLADCSDDKKIPIIMTGNDFSNVYAPLLRSGRADIYRWKPDMVMKATIIRSILDPFVMLKEDEYVQFFDKFRKGTISDFSQLKNDCRKKYVWQIIKDENFLNMETIHRLNRNMSPFKRLNFLEICELAEKRIEPFIERGMFND